MTSAFYKRTIKNSCPWQPIRHFRNERGTGAEKMSRSCSWDRSWGRALQLLGTLRSNDADGKQERQKKKKQKNNRFYKQNNNFARASRFFVHFFARFCTTTT